jgi:hypothetical protein
MKLTLQAVGALVLTVSVFVLGGWLLQVIITKWLLTFGITT